ncbi:MAG: N-acetyl-gamma-glutamyl-phosphate reductase [Gammaproteobacteria bacterium]
MSTARIPTLVLGGTGYVAGEMLRLLTGHPNLTLAGAVSRSRAGDPIGAVFPQLGAAYDGSRFVGPDEAAGVLQRHGELAVFSAAPHGASAAMLAGLLDEARGAGCRLRIVDASADFRYESREAFETVYGQPHGAPELIDEFRCAVPEHLADCDRPHAAHPGCFATSVLLGAVPLLSAGLIRPTLYVAGITGSTGSGRSPTPTTHHPERHSNLFAYKPLAHRHAPEIAALARAASGVAAAFSFVPHSGPFARGIHSTLQAPLADGADAEALREALSEYYREAPFVRVLDGTPRVKDVAGSNYAHIGVAAADGTAAVFVVIDNLLKGAAGGALQWMNRLWSLPETAGLTQPAPGWI